MTSFSAHFQTMMVTDTSLEASQEIEISEFVAPGQLLVSLPDVNAKRSETILPKACENTELDVDETGVFATCFGYPRIELSSTERGPTARVSVNPLITIAENLMEAQFTLYPPIPPASPPDLQTLLNILSQAGVDYGVDSAAIELALTTVVKTGLPLFNYIVARGKAPRPGKDAILTFEVDVGARPGKLLANGSIDFRERMMFVAVSENQILARKSPPTSGTPGMNLAGESIAASGGKDLEVKVSEDASFCHEDNTVRATASGVLTLVNDDTIRVSSQHKIEGDINYSTGNIRSQSAVHITGSIFPGFMVSTKGDLLVGGNIQKAAVNSHGNIIVKGGILGPSANVRVQGDADIHYIERSLLNAGGNIIIRSNSYYSTVVAAGSILCPDKVKLVGGDIIAGESIAVGQLGSTSAEPLCISVGIDPRRYRRYREVQKTYQELLFDIQKYYNRHGQQKKTKAILRMEEQLADLERELGGFNLVPGTPENSLGNRDCFYTDAQITVTGKITAGAIIRIGNETTRIKRDLEKSRIYMDITTGAITVAPL